MIVVIQCAASKRRDAGHFQTKAGKKVLFVADPGRAPKSSEVIYARPDDRADDGASWREHIRRYNKAPDNPFGLAQAYMLYENETYRDLVRMCGIGNVMILSAGWGLIPAEFLTPRYDITFSASAEPYARRRKHEHYQDFCLLPAGTSEPVVFFGGRDYVPLFAELTSQAKRRIVFYNSTTPPLAPGCSLKHFHTTTRTNWHYECARTFMAGTIDMV